MIEFKKCYSTSDGQAFEDLEKAKAHELVILLGKLTTTVVDIPAQNVNELANWILDNAAEVTDILTTNSTSKPAARRLHGGRKNRTPKTQPQPQPASA